jgi:predicted RecA/RadA family phage recombinase
MAAMKNFVQPGDTVTLPAPTGGVTSGQAFKSGSLFGVAAYTAAENAEVEVALTGVYDLPCVGPITQAAPVYWDDAAGKITAAGTTLVGTALLAVGSGGTTARVRLNGVALAA